MDLPSEISLQTDPIARWLMYLHYKLKPVRTTWRIGAGLNVCGMFFPGDRIDDAGKFSFEKLSENSYSIIGNIALSSIRAIRRLQSAEKLSGLSALTYDHLIKSPPFIIPPVIEDMQTQLHSESSETAKSTVNNVNKRKKSPKGDVLDLCMYLREHWGENSERELAREFFKDTAVAEKWLSKLNMARRDWKHLWHPDHM